MTMTHSHSHRRIDSVGMLLFLIGIISAAGCYWLIETRDLNPLCIVPAIVAATNGASHLTKREAPRNWNP